MARGSQRRVLATATAAKALSREPEENRERIGSVSGEVKSRTALIQKISLTEAVRAHTDSLYAYARYLSRDPELSKDLVQETFLKAARAWHQFDGRHPRSYLKAILRNSFLAYQDQEKRKVSLSRPLQGDQGDPLSLLDLLPAPEEAWTPPPLSEWERLGSEFDAPLMNALRALPDEWRELVLLRELHEFSYQELAEHFSIPSGTVMSRLSRARRRLRAALTADEQATA